MRGAFIFLLFSFLLAGSLFAGAFLDRMAQTYIPNGEADSASLAILNAKSEKFPSALVSFMNSEERLNFIITSSEGEILKIKADVYKSEAGVPQLSGLSLGAHASPTAIIYTNEETAQRIYEAKDESKEIRKAISSGGIKVEFPGDFLRGFFWSVANAFTGIMNAFV